MKTLIVFGGEPLGISEDNLNVGDVIKLTEKAKVPLVVGQILPMPRYETDENWPKDMPNTWRGIECDFIAYLHYNEKANQKFKSQKLEKSLAKNLKGKTRPGSGAFGFFKGDVMSDIWLGEHKYTDKESYRFMKDIWFKIKDEAFSNGKTPLMEVVLEASISPLKLIILDIKDFMVESNSSEEDLNSVFHFEMYKTNGKSILLNKKEINNFFELVRNNYMYKIPAFFLEYKDELTLIGMETKDFLRIFND
jgi:hypothetical protein